jgi:cyanophycin synthetase
MNTLPAILATYLFRNIRIEDIKLALNTFIPSDVQTPGRMNLFQFRNFQVLLDFAHNPAGLQLLCDFVNKLDATNKVAIIAGTGDRRDEDIKKLGRIAGGNFNDIIIRQDSSLRGRTAEEINELLAEGIKETRKPETDVKIILNEEEAIVHAFSTAKPGSIITIMADKVYESLELIKKLKEEDDRVKAQE